MILIKVVVGVILNDQKNQVFLTKRRSNQDLAGMWEFPGGKIEDGESVGDALYRELKEEIGIEVKQFVPLLIKQYSYAHKAVELHCFIVSSYFGIPTPQESQEGKWVHISQLDTIEMPEANKEIVEKLRDQLGRKTAVLTS